MSGLAVTLAFAGCAAENEPSGAPTRATTQTSDYADGSYTAIGEYGGEPSHITLTVALTGNTVTFVDVVPHATNPTSLDYQERFADAIDAVVIGQPIADLEVSKTAGSSGTPQGFNDALDQIRTQAADTAVPAETT